MPDLPSVVHVTSVHRPFDGRIFEKQCRSLASRGYDVTLVAPHDREEIVDGVRMVPIRKSKGRLGRMTLMATRAMAAAVRTRADIVHVHDPELLPFALAPMLLGRSVVFDMHENIGQDFDTKPWLPKPLVPLGAALWELLSMPLLRASSVVFAEDSYRESYPALTPGVVIHNYPRLETLRSLPVAFRDDTFTIAYFGSISVFRGILTMLDALLVLGDRGLRPRFLCVGQVPSQLKLEITKRVEQLGRGQVEFTGFLPYHEGVRRVSAAHLGLALLDRHPNLEDSLPTKLLEYMVLGLPVITSDFPLYRRIVDEAGCGVCITPGEPQQLADIVATYMADAQRVELEASRGEAYVRENFSWDDEADALVVFYQTVASSRRKQSEHG